MDKYIREYKKTRERTQYVHEKLKDGTFMNDKSIMDELMDDSNLHEDAYNYSKIRIGEKYQCDIPPYNLLQNNTYSNKSNNTYSNKSNNSYSNKSNNRYNLRNKKND